VILVPTATWTVRPSSPSPSRSEPVGGEVMCVAVGDADDGEGDGENDAVADGDGDPVPSDGDGDGAVRAAPSLHPQARRRASAAASLVPTAASRPSRYLMVTIIVLNSLTPSGNVTVVDLPPAVTESV
jgi:hypothetical protein